MFILEPGYGGGGCCPVCEDLGRGGGADNLGFRSDPGVEVEEDWRGERLGPGSEEQDDRRCHLPDARAAGEHSRRNESSRQVITKF